MPLFVTGKKHLAFISHLFAQQPIIWCLLTHQKGYKVAVNKISPLSMTMQKKKIQAQTTYQTGTRFLTNCNGKVTTAGWSFFWESPAEASIWGEEPSAPSDVLVSWKLTFLSYRIVCSNSAFHSHLLNGHSSAGHQSQLPVQVRGLICLHIYFSDVLWHGQNCATHLVTCIYLPPRLFPALKLISMFFHFNFMCINVLCSTNVCALHVCLESVEEGKGVHFPGTRATESCESSYGCRDWNGVPWKSSQLWYLLRHLSSLCLISF